MTEPLIEKYGLDRIQQNKILAGWKRQMFVFEIYLLNYNGGDKVGN